MSRLNSAKDIWNTLAEISVKNVSLIYELYQNFFSCQQGDRLVQQYY